MPKFSKKSKKGKKCANGWIRFCAEKSKNVLKHYPGKKFGERSTILGKVWKELPPETRTEYHKMARAEADVAKSVEEASSDSLPQKQMGVYSGPKRGGYRGGRGRGGGVRGPRNVARTVTRDVSQGEARTISIEIKLTDHVHSDGEVIYQVDVFGFRAKELKVHLEGTEIVVQGEHKELNQDELVHNQLMRRKRIPKDIVQESIRCDLDPEGSLCLWGKRQTVEPTEVRTIPIEKAKQETEAQQKQQEEVKSKQFRHEKTKKKHRSYIGRRIIISSDEE